MSWWRKRSLRLKLALGISVTMLISLSIAFLGVSRYIQAYLWQQETQSAKHLNSIAATLFQDAMMSGRKDKIHETLVTLGQSFGDQIDSIAVYDDQAVLTSYATGFSGRRDISKESLDVDLTDPTCWGCHQIPAAERPTLMIITLEGKEVIRNVVPLYNEPRCQTCHGTGIAVLGDSIVDFRLDDYQHTVTIITIGIGAGIAGAILFVAVVLYYLLRRIVIAPIDKLVEVSQAVVQGDLKQRVRVQSADEMGQLGNSFNSMTNQLGGLLEDLEQRVADRTQALEQRANYLETSSDIGKAATTVLDPDQLIRDVVDLIKQRFDFYYVGLFMSDDQKEWCVLKAGSGTAGQAMLKLGFRIKIGEGMVGWCVAHNEARVALNIGEDKIRYDVPDLPDTKSEAALPLRSRGKVLGAISVQSDNEAAFDEEFISVLQTMVDQVAVGLDNARLFTEAEKALEAERYAYGELSQQAWSKILRYRPEKGYRFARQAVFPIDEDWTPEMSQAIESGQIVQTAENSTLAVPLKVREQVIGVLNFRKENPGKSWTTQEISLLETLTKELGQTLETARLYEETQVQAANERVIGDVSAKIRQTLDIETVIQTAARELRSVLDLAEVEIRMGGDASQETESR